MSDTANTWKKNPVATGLVGLVVGLLLAYGVGLWQRSSALSAQAEANAAVVASKDAEIAASAERLADAQRRTAVAESRGALVSVRLAIFQAINDLDQRNFGVASDRLREAASLFGQVDGVLLGLAPDLLATLQTELAGTQVLVASDLEQQRLRLLELAARIDAQTAPALAAPVAGSPAR